MAENAGIEIFEICNLIQGLIKVDVHYIDEEGQMIFQAAFQTQPGWLKKIQLSDFEQIHAGLEEKEADQCLWYTNEVNLSYLGVGNFTEDIFRGSVIIGPFLDGVLVEHRIKEIMNFFQVSLPDIMNFKAYYRGLNVFNEIERDHLCTVALNLIRKPMLKPKTAYMNRTEPGQRVPGRIYDKKEERALIEQRYAMEKEILLAVKRGDKDQVIGIFRQWNTRIDIPERYASMPLRYFKNITYCINTMYRLAAESGGVPPIYINSISERLVAYVEKATNYEALEKLQGMMLVAYCDAVKSLSTAEYSTLVRKAVEMIYFSFDEALTLESIAEELMTSPSHLSRKFKQEVGMSIKNYINLKRIEHAKILLDQGNESITDIAFMVGYNSLNYFSTVFKNVTNMTPREYMRNRRRAIE